IAFGTQNGTVTIDGTTQRVPADNTTLQEIATSTGGSFHTAASESELSSVYKDIGSQIGYTTKQHDVSWRYMLAGLLFLFGAAGGWSGARAAAGRAPAHGTAGGRLAVAGRSGECGEAGVQEVRRRGGRMGRWVNHGGCSVGPGGGEES